MFPAPLSDFQLGDIVRRGENLSCHRFRERYPDAIRDLREEQRGFRSMPLHPLMRDGKPIGLIGVTRERARPLRRSRRPVAPDLRRPGGYRDRECAAVQRNAGGAGAADRDGQHPEGDRRFAVPTCSQFSTRSLKVRKRWEPICGHESMRVNSTRVRALDAMEKSCASFIMPRRAFTVPTPFATVSSTARTWTPHQFNSRCPPVPTRAGISQGLSSPVGFLATSRRAPVRRMTGAIGTSASRTTNRLGSREKTSRPPANLRRPGGRSPSRTRGCSTRRRKRWSGRLPPPIFSR